MNTDSISNKIVKISKWYLIIIGFLIICIGIWQSINNELDGFMILTGFLGIESIVIGIIIKSPADLERVQSFVRIDGSDP